MLNLLGKCSLLYRKGIYGAFKIADSGKEVVYLYRNCVADNVNERMAIKMAGKTV